MKSKYIKLFADAEGQSHFKDCETELSPVQLVPNAEPLYLASFGQVEQLSFFASTSGWESDWHVSASRSLFVLLSGVWEIEASDGEKRVVRPTEILLAEDTTGRGHRSRVCSEGDSLALMVQLKT